MNMPKNWKTTVSGIITAIGPVAVALPPPYNFIAAGLGAVGAVLLGTTAKSYDVHSTAAEVRQAQ